MRKNYGLVLFIDALIQKLHKRIADWRSRKMEAPQ